MLDGRFGDVVKKPQARRGPEMGFDLVPRSPATGGSQKGRRDGNERRADCNGRA
jgi:hypothetical protein